MAYQDIGKRIRECKKCGKIKGFDEFVKSDYTTYGIVWTCKECNRKYVKERNKNINIITSEYDKYNTYRICSSCKKSKILNDFPINKIVKKGRAYQCKQCRLKSSIKFAKENPEIIKERSKIRYQKNKDIKKKTDKEYYQKNKDSIKRRTSEYRKKEENRENRNKREVERRITDLNYKIVVNLRGRLRHIVKNKNTVIQGTTEELLGCSIDFFINHIESQFTEGMSWDKIGLYGIHLDHIIPLSNFDLEKKEEQLRAMNWRNMQPLWAKDNLQKGAKLNWIKDE